MVTNAMRKNATTTNAIMKIKMRERKDRVCDLPEIMIPYFLLNGYMI